MVRLDHGGRAAVRVAHDIEYPATVNETATGSASRQREGNHGAGDRAMILVFHARDRCAPCTFLDIVGRTLPVFDNDIQFGCNRWRRFGHPGLPRSARAKAIQKECHSGDEAQVSHQRLFCHFDS
jgi:hypothetical protein